MLSNIEEQANTHQKLTYFNIDVIKIKYLRMNVFTKTYNFHMTILLLTLISISSDFVSWTENIINYEIPYLDRILLSFGSQQSALWAKC